MAVRLRHDEEGEQRESLRQEVRQEDDRSTARALETRTTLLSSGMLDRVFGVIVGLLPLISVILSVQYPAVSRWDKGYGFLIPTVVSTVAFFGLWRPYAQVRKSLSVTYSLYLVPAGLLCVVSTAVWFVQRFDWPGLRGGKMMSDWTTFAVLFVGVLGGLLLALSAALLRAAFPRREAER